jgi:hypothetical protein
MAVAKPIVDKWLDLVDRAGWTAVQAFLGVAAAWLIGDMGWREVGATVLVATAAAVAKVKIGQNTGTDDTGSLIGTSVIQPPPQEGPKPVDPL